MRVQCLTFETWQPGTLQYKAEDKVQCIYTVYKSSHKHELFVYISVYVGILLCTHVATNEHDAEQLRRALEQARSHPLFPVLDYMARKLHTLSEKLDLVDKKLGQLEAEVTVNFPASQKDVKDLIKEQGKKMFKIKGSAYEVTCTSSVLEIASMTTCSVYYNIDQLQLNHGY